MLACDVPPCDYVSTENYLLFTYSAEIKALFLVQALPPISATGQEIEICLACNGHLFVQ